MNWPGWSDSGAGAVACDGGDEEVVELEVAEEVDVERKRLMVDTRGRARGRRNCRYKEGFVCESAIVEKVFVILNLTGSEQSRDIFTSPLLRKWR